MKRRDFLKSLLAIPILTGLVKAVGFEPKIATPVGGKFLLTKEGRTWFVKCDDCREVTATVNGKYGKITPLGLVPVCDACAQPHHPYVIFNHSRHEASVCYPAESGL